MNYLKLLFTAFDRDLLTGCAACLRARGYEVAEAFDCPSAVELASSERFDAALVDISRHDRDVSGLQRLLLDSDVPVIALTEKEDSVKRLTSAPVACSYLCHPFTPDELAGCGESAVVSRRRLYPFPELRLFAERRLKFRVALASLQLVHDAPMDKPRKVRPEPSLLSIIPERRQIPRKIDKDCLHDIVGVRIVEPLRARDRKDEPGVQVEKPPPCRLVLSVRHGLEHARPR